MNEKSEPAAPQGLQEGPASFASASTVPPPELSPAARVDQMLGADPPERDLTGVEGLLPKDLAGKDLTGAKLPEDIEKFPALEQVKAISGEARKVFAGLLAACVYSWLVIGTTTDVQLILDTASSPLPIINTSIPIAGFYVVGAAILAAVYCYLHFYLQRLWRTLAALPAIFPDGVALDDKSDPWLLTNLVRTDFKLLQADAPPLVRLENLLAVFLAWWLVPITLISLWIRYLPAHDGLGISVLILLIFATIHFGRHTYALARDTLQGPNESAERDRDRGIVRREVLQTSTSLSRAKEGYRDRGFLIGALRELRALRVGDLTACLTIALVVVSYSSFVLSPRDLWTIAWALNTLGIRTYADLREVDVAQKPDGWDGKDLSKVKRVDLRGRNLAFADAGRAFLANADLRGADLRGADLGYAQLEGANLGYAQLEGANLGEAQLQGADLHSTQLQGADLRSSGLQGANLSDAQLQGADLSLARLQGANLSFAELQGADLYSTHLQGADLTDVELQGSSLKFAQFQGARLVNAHLQGAESPAPRQLVISLAPPGPGDVLLANRLPFAESESSFQGADLRRAALWRASFGEAHWDFADLSRTDVRPMTESDIDALIREATKNIPDKARREAVAERLTAALLTGHRSPRPDFPDEWRSKPNVMFRPGDPDPQPFGWGPRAWATEGAYDEDLAKYLANVACGPDLPEAQTRGLAERAIVTADLSETEVGEPDRSWPKLFAARLLGPNCPPAEGLPEDMRRKLEQIAFGSSSP